jgi:RNA polymerase sigma factor (sigma-70 family)
LHGLAGGAAVAAASDRELLERFCARRDEAAFAQLLRRHGPMVLHVGRRVLGPAPDAEDVFQATFLLLARKAESIRKRQSVGSWLHGVAHHLALQARTREARRKAHERRAASMREATTAAGAAWRELQEVLDQALAEVPEKYRAVLVLCCLGGQTQEQAARQLGCPLGTVGSRLARGRALLRARLARRGLALSAAALATALAANGAPAALPAGLAKAALQAGVRFAAGDGAAGLVSAGAATLAERGLKTMFAGKAKAVTALVLAAGLLIGGAGTLTQEAVADREPPAKQVGETQPAEPPAAPADRPRVDRYGDPLPAGAVARIGTARLQHGDYIWSLAFSPDGKALVSTSGDGTVRLWDAATGKELRRLSGDFRRLRRVAFALSGRAVVAGAMDDPAVRLWDWASGKELRRFGDSKNLVGAFALSPDGKTLVQGSADLLQVWDTDTGKELRQIKGTGGVIDSLAYSPDGKTVAVVWRDKTVRRYDVVAGTEVGRIEAEAAGAASPAFSSDGKLLALACADKAVRLWEVATGKERFALKGDHEFNGSVAFAPDGKTLAAAVGHRASAQGPGLVVLWDVATGKEVRRFKGRPDYFTAVAFSPDGKALAAGGTRGLVQVWDVETGKDRLPVVGPPGGVRQVRFLPDGKTLATVGGWIGPTTDTDTIYFWEAATGREVRRLSIGAPVGEVAFSADGKSLAVATWDGKVHLHEAGTGKEMRQLPGQHFWMGGVFIPDGKGLVTVGAADHVLRLWRVDGGEELRRFPGHGGPVGALAVSPDGTTLATASSADQKVRLWDLSTGKERRQLLLAAGPFFALAFSPDGRTLAAAEGTNPVDPNPAEVRLWDVATGKERRRLEGIRDHMLLAVAFSPDGRLLATGGDDRAVRLWEVASGKERRQFAGHDGLIYSVSFSPDGRLLASTGRDSTALVWDLTGKPGPPAARGKPLTAKELESAWADLAVEDAARAYQAICRLAAAPDESLPYLRKHVRPVAPVDEKRVARLIADLDSDEFAVREKAADELDKLGESAAGAVRQALAGRPSAELRRRLEALLDKQAAEEWAPAPDRLRAVRALEMLEQVGTPEAKKLLAELAQGAPEAWLTREAKAALGRLKRPAAQP